MTRRELFAAVPIAGMTPLLHADSPATLSGDSQEPSPYDGNQKTERYILLGKRMVFTNWYFVRQGNFTWLDKDGKSVFFSKQALGPWDARFQERALPRGVKLVAQAAQRIGPTIAPERPWEQAGVSINTVIQEHGLFRAWAVCFWSGQKSVPAYFESQDGLTWRRPNLSIREWEGNRANNLLDDPNSGEAAVFMDPAGAPQEKYKWVSHRHYTKAVFEAYLKRNPGAFDPMTQDNSDPNSFHGCEGAVSADGLRWTRLPDPLVFESADTQNVCYYDLRRRKYVLYTRAYMGAGRSARRAIGRSETQDFHSFPVSRIVLETSPDMTPSDTLYTNCRTTIPGAPDHHLMFPAIYQLTVDSTKIAFASSHDGDTWSFVPGSPLAQPGTFGEWDGGALFAHPNLLELSDGGFALPYTGYSFPHKYPRGAWKMGSGYLTWPKGRLVAIEASDVGEFSTVAFIAPGRSLLINAVTQRAGGIQVEVAGHDEKPIPGRSFSDCAPIIGDRYKSVVTWSGQKDLGHQENSPIVLRFRMKGAQIFGLEFV
jgi:hypothetical protein